MRNLQVASAIHFPFRRRAAVSGAAVAMAVSVVGAVASPAHAYDRIESGACPGFDVGITTESIDGNQNNSWPRFPNVLVAGSRIITLANMETGAAVSVRTSGSTSTEPREPVPGATTFFVKGSFLVVFPEGGPYSPQGPMTALFTGTVAFQDDNDIVTVQSLTGKTVDLCPALAG